MPKSERVELRIESDLLTAFDEGCARSDPKRTRSAAIVDFMQRQVARWREKGVLPKEAP